MKGTARKGICLLLALFVLLEAPATVRAATELPDAIYLTQEGYSTCTLCSTAMMLRARMYLSGDDRWDTVTESSLRPVAWVSGMGLKWLFTYELEAASMTVSHASLSGISVESLRSLLEAHPEGIVLYCGGLPHAVFLTDYEDGVFYCAEPVEYYSGRRIPLDESYLGNQYGTQERILANVTAYWYVSAYSINGSQGSAPECSCSEEYAGIYLCNVSADSSLNIRSGHGTGYSWVGSIPAGAEVEVTKASGTGDSDWAHVVYDGVKGYVSMQYLAKKEAEPETPPEPEKPKPVETTPMYRLYNPNSGEHFYTGSADERDMLDDAGWNYEGIAWNAPTKSGKPVYRLYNPNSGDHHYTMSVDERDWLADLGWQYEGVAWNSAGNDGTPLYRLYNPNADCGSHHYTGSTQERDHLVGLGWVYEGIGWYGMNQ